MINARSEEHTSDWSSDVCSSDLDRPEEAAAVRLGRLMAMGLLRKLRLQLQPDQDLSLQLIPSPTPKDGLLVQAIAR